MHLYTLPSAVAVPLTIASYRPVHYVPPPFNIPTDPPLGYQVTHHDKKGDMMVVMMDQDLHNYSPQQQAFGASFCFH